MNFRGLGRFLVIGGCLAGLYLLAADNLKDRKQTNNAPAKVIIEDKPVSRDTKFTTSFAPIVKKVAKSVVNIYTTKKVSEREIPPELMDPFFRFFGGPPGGGGGRFPREEQSLGSGVIVTTDGYILTAAHVIEGADEVKVSYDNERITYTAKIIGTDPQTDIGVLKVEAKDLPAISLADSDKIEIGDVALALGNPFSVGQTVTMGIISATGRGGFGIVDYEDFIQTDASINPGNSGGALVDAEGRLIGINTAILSRSGGNQGIGFAVPINMARMIMDRLITDGKVTRGYLGIYIQSLTPELVSYFKLPELSGALVGGLSPDGPGGKAGLKEGDVITEYNGKKVADSRTLRLAVSQTPPGTKVTLKVFRDGKERTITATLEELPDEEGRTSPRRGSAQKNDLLDGVTVTDLDQRLRREMNIPSRITGAVVTDVDPSSPAARQGLRPGDVILEINQEPVKNADDAIAKSEKVEGDRVLLRVWSSGPGGGGGSRFVVVQRPPNSRR